MDLIQDDEWEDESNWEDMDEDFEPEEDDSE